MDGLLLLFLLQFYIVHLSVLLMRFYCEILFTQQSTLTTVADFHYPPVKLLVNVYV